MMASEHVYFITLSHLPNYVKGKDFQYDTCNILIGTIFLAREPEGVALDATTSGEAE